MTFINIDDFLAVYIIILIVAARVHKMVLLCVLFHHILMASSNIVNLQVETYEIFIPTSLHIEIRLFLFKN